MGERERCSPCFRGEMDYEGGMRDETERTPDMETDVGRMSEAVKREGYIPVKRLAREDLHALLTSWTRSRDALHKDTNVRM